jgi:hypothetical protein
LKSGKIWIIYLNLAVFNLYLKKEIKMEIYKWLTPIGEFNSFSDLVYEYKEKKFNWYQAIKRKDDFEPTVVKYICDCCEILVIGVMLIKYKNNVPIINLSKDTMLNDIMTHLYDFVPEHFMLKKKIIDTMDIKLFNSEFIDSFRDIDYASATDEEIYNLFNIKIKRPILNLNNYLK